LPALHLLLPGDPAIRTGGYLYDARIVAGLREQGWTVTVHTLADSFPDPDAAALAQADATLRAIPAGASVVIDGLALGGMPELVAEQSGRLRLLALIHHPLALETGLTMAEQAHLFGAERKALAVVARVIVTSPSTAAALAGYGVAQSRIGVVTPGVDPAPLAVGSGSAQLNLLCVGALIPRKGHADLLMALSTLKDRHWRLDCIGSMTRHPATTALLQSRIAEMSLTGQVELLGEVGEQTLADYYHRADLFVLPSYHEGYGMALAEAIARGLPIISTTAGAIPDTVPNDAAVLIPPGDRVALAAALRELLDQPERRRQLAAAARTARQQLPDWPMACERFAAEVREVS